MNRHMKVDSTDFIAFLKQVHRQRSASSAHEESFAIDESDAGFAIDLGEEPELQTTSSSILKKDWDFWGGNDSE